MKIMPFRLFRVTDESMQPEYAEGDYVLVNQWFGNLKDDDVVIVKHPSKGMLLLKRIFSIRDNKLFVLGDNTLVSEDSRMFGDVDIANVAGKVIHKF